jgi:AhpC/TSA family
MMKRLLFGSVVLLLFGAVVLAGGCGTTGAGKGASAGGALVHVANGAPVFSGKTLGGAPVSLESYRGKPLVLIFWASW